MDKKKEAREQLISLGAEVLADIILQLDDRLTAEVENANKYKSEEYTLGLINGYNAVNAVVQQSALRYALARGLASGKEQKNAD